MSKTTEYILTNNVNVNPDVVDDSDSDEMINQLAEEHQLKRDYERMINLGHVPSEFENAQAY